MMRDGVLHKHPTEPTGPLICVVMILGNSVDVLQLP
jgi:hypothetical protein